MRLVCDCCNDITNIEADRMEIQGDKLMVYSRGRLVYVADLGQIMLAKLTPGRDEQDESTRIVCRDAKHRESI